MSQTFCYHCVEYIRFDTCAKFHDHQSNNNKVMMGRPSCPPFPMTDGSKKRMSNRVKDKISFSREADFGHFGVTDTSSLESTCQIRIVSCFSSSSDTFMRGFLNQSFHVSQQFVETLVD